MDTSETSYQLMEQDDGVPTSSNQLQTQQATGMNGHGHEQTAELSTMDGMDGAPNGLSNGTTHSTMDTAGDGIPDTTDAREHIGTDAGTLGQKMSTLGDSVAHGSGHAVDDSLDNFENVNEFEQKSFFFSDDLANRNAGPWMKCLPKQITLPVATISFAILGLIIGFIISLETNPSDLTLELIYYPGNLWVRGLKLLILPLIISIMMIIPSSLSGDLSSGDLSTKNMGSLAMKFYTCTSFVAAIEGTIWGNLIAPGKQVSVDEFAEFESDGETTDTRISWWESILSIGENAIPENIVDAMYSLNILGIIVVFLTIGILLNNINESHYSKYDKHYQNGATTLIEICKTILRLVMIVIGYFIWFTPFGMLSLVTYQCAATDNLVQLLTALGYYVVTVVLGQFVHLFIFYPLIFFIVTQGGNAWRHWWKIKYAAMVAFATSSSAATLSVALNVAKTSGQVSSNVVNFIIPLGATVNMDGAGLSYPIQVLFIAQLYDINLNFGTQMTVLILSVVCSVGAAPIPSAGMVYLIMLLTVAGNGLEDDTVIATAVATLFLIDWFIDRIGTSVNVSSDQYVAKMIDYIFEKKNSGQNTCATRICCMK